MAANHEVISSWTDAEVHQFHRGIHLTCSDLKYNMITFMNVNAWTSFKVNEWLLGLFDDTGWLNSKIITGNNIDGKKLLLMVAHDLRDIGITKVDRQEAILEAIEDLRFHNYDIKDANLQLNILKVACQSASLRACLESKHSLAGQDKNSAPSKDVTNGLSVSKQIVSLDTLTAVSYIVRTVQQIAEILGRPPYTHYGVYRSMRSLLLALSIELTSTAQRDQFVERPNDIIKKCSGTLAEYCHKIVEYTRHPLLVHPFRLETVKIEKNSTETNLGLVINSEAANDAHLIHAILPLSPAKKTNKLDPGDEIIQFNQCIVRWSAKNVQKIIEASWKRSDVILMVKKSPRD